ncbi:MAG: UPF0158 family protein [Planctomycetota bacterium]
MKDVPRLEDIMDAVEQAHFFEDGHALIHRRTGEIFVRADYDDIDPEDLRIRERIEAEEGEWVGLPDRFDFDEYRVMRRFAGDHTESPLTERLLDTIGGRGTFRRFKNLLAEKKGLLDAWYEFRLRALEKKVVAELEAEDIPFRRA